MITMKRVLPLFVAGTLALAAGGVKAEPERMQAALATFEAASTDLVDLYEASEAIARLIATTTKRRAEAEKAIETAFKAINHEDPAHGKVAEEVFGKIIAANQTVEKAHLQALDAQASAEHAHAAVLAKAE